MRIQLSNGHELERGRLLLIWPALYKLWRDDRPTFNALWRHVHEGRPLTVGVRQKLARDGFIVDGRVPTDVARILQASYRPDEDKLEYPKEV